MKHCIIILLSLVLAVIPAHGQSRDYSQLKNWLEIPSFTEDNNHFLIIHYTDEYWGRQRNFCVFWDVQKQIPLWVAYPLNKKLIGRGQRSGSWQYDAFVSTKKQPNLRKTYQAGNVEGYIRGHLCPSSDRLSAEMNQQTFFFTNVAPQDPYLNGGLWSYLEDEVRRLALDADDAWVVTGCIDDDDSNWVTDMNRKRISVPEMFFKAVLTLKDDGNPTTIDYVATAWIVENRSYGFSGFETKAAACSVSTDKVEQITKLDLWPTLTKIIGVSASEIVERQ